MKVPPRDEVQVALRGGAALGDDERRYVEQAARARLLLDTPPDPTVTTAAAGYEVVMGLPNMVEKGEEIARINKELAEAKRKAAELRGRLANPDFLAKAPAAVVHKQREQLAALEERIALQEQRRAMFEG
jgi:valyl-tRNA synthetase